MIVNMPDMRAIDAEGDIKGWSPERKYQEYYRSLADSNPHLVYHDGSPRSIWSWLRGRWLRGLFW